MTSSRVVKCVGTLSANDFDDFGNPIQLIFVDERGNEYIVKEAELWQELCFYLDEDMWISAQVVDEADELPVIDVDSYRVFDSKGDGQSSAGKQKIARKNSWDDDW